MLRVIAVIKDGKQTVGYRLYDENSASTGDFNVEDAYRQLSHYGSLHARLYGQTLVCKDGDVDTLPVLDARTLECIENDVIIVLDEILRDGKVWGYKVTDYSGRTENFSVSEFLSCEDIGYYNARVVHKKEGKKIISAVKRTVYGLAVNSISERGKDYKKLLKSNPDEAFKLYLNGVIEQSLRERIEVKPHKISKSVVRDEWKSLITYSCMLDITYSCMLDISSYNREEPFYLEFSILSDQDHDARIYVSLQSPHYIKPFSMGIFDIEHDHSDERLKSIGDPTIIPRTMAYFFAFTLTVTDLFSPQMSQDFENKFLEDFHDGMADFTMFNKWEDYNSDILFKGKESVLFWSIDKVRN